MAAVIALVVAPVSTRALAATGRKSCAAGGRIKISMSGLPLDVGQLNSNMREEAQVDRLVRHFLDGKQPVGEKVGTLSISRARRSKKSITSPFFMRA
jgi:hypothetical protein